MVMEIELILKKPFPLCIKLSDNSFSLLTYHFIKFDKFKNSSNVANILQSVISELEIIFERNRLMSIKFNTIGTIIFINNLTTEDENRHTNTLLLTLAVLRPIILISNYNTENQNRQENKSLYYAR